jgi:phosphoribosylformimino-5-aminoimidazole carboxamide ribotide isomerase
VIVLPAIDLLSGRVVRLRQGDFRTPTMYAEDPVEVARTWMRQGAQWVHVVDLDGARTGRPHHLAVVERIAAEGVRVQLGGGLRDEETIAQALRRGASRVVVGTVALRDLALLARLCARFNERIAVALDVRDGQVTVAGWREEEPVTLEQAAEQVLEAGVGRFVVTDVRADGMLRGPNLDLYRRAVALGVPVIASGGIRDLADIAALREVGVEGVIVGRALYEGIIPLTQALAAAGQGG